MIRYLITAECNLRHVRRQGRSPWSPAAPPSSVGDVTTRRAVLAAAGRAGLVALLSGCAERRIPVDGSADRAALAARPGDAPPASPPTPGRHALEVEPTRDSALHVPPRLHAPAAPLLVVLHGAGGHAEGAVSLLRPVADAHGIVLLAPASRGATWDGIRDGYGPDVDVLDRSLEQAFRLVAVDPQRIGVAGFSDGASYALGVGLANGGLFPHVLAFSPGFVPPAGREGHPRIFVSHGTADEVLPIDRTSRRIVPALERDGYEVEYVEFEGGHTVPREIARRAIGWFGESDPPSQ